MSDVVVSRLVREVAMREDLVVVETLLPPRLFWLNRVVLPLRIVLSSVMAKIRGSGVIVGSFSNVSLASMCLAGWIHGNRCVAILNHNHTTKNFIVRLGIWLLGRSGARVLAFDLPCGRSESSDWIRPWFLREVLSVPHPVIASRSQKRFSGDDRLIHIGVAGRIRKEKGLAESVRLIERLQEDLQRDGYSVVPVVAAPVDAWEQIRQYLPSWKLVDTTRYEDYVAALRGLDMVVLLYSRDSYELRPSGVASEAIAEGVFVVAIDTPVIRKQLSDPVPVGYCMDDASPLDLTVRNIRDAFKAFRKEKGDAYLAARDLSAVVSLIAGSDRKGGG